MGFSVSPLAVKKLDELLYTTTLTWSRLLSEKNLSKSVVWVFYRARALGDSTREGRIYVLV